MRILLVLPYEISVGEVILMLCLFADSSAFRASGLWADSCLQARRGRDWLGKVFFERFFLLSAPAPCPL